VQVTTKLHEFLISTVMSGPFPDGKVAPATL